MNPLQSIWAWRFWREYRCSTRSKTWAVHQGCFCFPYRVIGLHTNLITNICQKNCYKWEWQKLTMGYICGWGSFEVMETEMTKSQLTFQAHNVQRQWQIHSGSNLSGYWTANFKNVSETSMFKFQDQSKQWHSSAYSLSFTRRHFLWASKRSLTRMKVQPEMDSIPPNPSLRRIRNTSRYFLNISTFVSFGKISWKYVQVWLTYF